MLGYIAVHHRDTNYKTWSCCWISFRVQDCSPNHFISSELNNILVVLFLLQLLLLL